MLNHDVETNSRHLAKIVRELLRHETFDDLGALTDALKQRCARLPLRWTNDDINDAYRLVGSNTRLPGGLTAVSDRVERLPEPPIVSRMDAVEILATLRARLGSVPIKTIRPVRRVTPFDQDKQQAKRMVAAEIVASIARCEALESALPVDAVRLSLEEPGVSTRVEESPSSSSSSVSSSCSSSVEVV